MFRSLAASIVVCSAHAINRRAAALLPDVEAILTNATSNADQFSQTAADIQRVVAEQQEKTYDHIGDLKRRYEARLLAQEEETEAIAAHVELLKRGNKNLRDTSDALEANATAVQEDNQRLRTALQTLRDKVAAASQFVQESFRVTDDKDAEELKVLTPTTPRPTLDVLLAAPGNGGASLLQLVEQEAPEELVGALSEGLIAIAAAEQAAEDQLKQEFERKFEAGRSKQAALNATVAQLLNPRRPELQARYAKLLEAQDFLMRKHNALRIRLDALRQFAQKLDAATGNALEADGAEDVRRASSSRANATLANGTNSSARPASSSEANATANGTALANASTTQHNDTRANLSMAEPRRNTTAASLRSANGSAAGGFFARFR